VYTGIMKQCLECLEEFPEYPYPNKKYCSVRCRLRVSSRKSVRRLRERNLCLRCTGPRDGSQVHCSKCRIIIYDHHRAKPQSRQIAQRKAVLKEYGLDLARLEEIRREQNGQCPICKDECELVVDHDHETGLFRGLLCGRCNCGLGFFRDSSYFLSEASKYLQRVG
jgi:hypothetical protein